MANIIRKLGTVDCDIVEANPIVWQGRLLRFEYIRERNAEKGYYANTSGTSYFRFVDQETGEILPAFGHGLHMGNAFVWEDKVYVTAVENWGKSRFYQLESSDLINWSTPKLILENPQWRGYNTSLCRAGDRFILAFELGAPAELVNVPFTMFSPNPPTCRTTAGYRMPFSAGRSIPVRPCSGTLTGSITSSTWMAPMRMDSKPSLPVPPI